MLVPLPGEGMLVGENVPVIPAGNPLIVSAIADLNPDAAVAITGIGIGEVEGPLPLGGPRASVNVAATGALTVSVTFAVSLMPPPEAVRVTV